MKYSSLSGVALLCASLLAAPVLASENAGNITVGFSPSGTALSNVLDVINSAHNSIDVAAYSFTSKEVAAALVKAAGRGVQVRVVADQKDNQKSPHSAVITMQENHIPVRLDGHYAIMHNKFMVVDEVTTETGSFNYTASADKRNAENALVIWNAPQLAAVYSQEFERLWQESSTPDATAAAPYIKTPSATSLRRSISHWLRP